MFPVCCGDVLTHGPGGLPCAGYAKLELAGIWVHACVDGGTNYVLWATVATNKSAQTLFYGYSQAVQRFGRPKLVRADHAREANMIGEDMVRVRGPGSYVIGASVHNQVRRSVSG